MAATNGNLISDIAAKATLYVAGKSPVDIGVSTLVIQTANKMVRSMSRAKFTTLALLALAIVPLVGSFSAMFGFRGDSIFGAAIFYDQFDDGNPADGMPVTWISGPGIGEGTSISVVDSSLSIVNSGFGAAAGPAELGQLSDVSIRSQVRLISGRAIGLSVRSVFPADFDNYFISLNTDGTVWLGIGTPSGEITLDTLSTDLRVLDEDVLLQLEVNGDSLKGWAWRPGSSQPAEPSLIALNDRIALGEVGVWAVGPSAHGQFRDVQVATVPEPATCVAPGIAILCVSCFGGNDMHAVWSPEYELVSTTTACSRR